MFLLFFSREKEKDSSKSRGQLTDKFILDILIHSMNLSSKNPSKPRSWETRRANEQLISNGEVEMDWLELNKMKLAEKLKKKKIEKQ